MILSTKTGESLFRSLLTKIPAVEKTRSEGTDVAGIASIFLATKESRGYFWAFSFHHSHVSAEVKGENMPERKVASTGDRTHKHQVMSPTRSPLIHPGGT